MQLRFTEQNFRSPCSISCALEIIGDKWTLLIVRDALFKGYNSFSQFRDSTEKIASNILTNRLEKLVSNGIFTKIKNPKNGLKYDYQLTEVGLELEPVLMAIGNWGLENIDGVNNVQDIIAFHKKTERNKI